MIGLEDIYSFRLMFMNMFKSKLFKIIMAAVN